MAPKQKYIENLIEEYGDMVYRLAISRVKSKEEAEDIFQEVFIKIYEKMPEFVSKEHEKYWIIRVTINLSKNYFTSAWYRKVNYLEEISFCEKDLFQDEDFEDNMLHNKESLKVSEDIISEVYFEVLRLPLKYRTIIQLFYYENLKIDEISEVLKIGSNTVKTRLRRARQKLKMNLEGGFENE